MVLETKKKPAGAGKAGFPFVDATLILSRLFLLCFILSNN